MEDFRHVWAEHCEADVGSEHSKEEWDPPRWGFEGCIICAEQVTGRVLTDARQRMDRRHGAHRPMGAFLEHGRHTTCKTR